MPVNVKFMVDMSNETVSSNGIHIAGDFQGWDPSSSQMTDEDGDGIYETSFELNIGTYQYKFVNGMIGQELIMIMNRSQYYCNFHGNREMFSVLILPFNFVIINVKKSA